MGVKDADVFMALAERNEELTERRLAVSTGLFTLIIEAEDCPPAKIELSEADLEVVRPALLRAIDREQAEVDARLRDQGVEFGGTVTISKDGEITIFKDDPAQG
jgi:hypothetical protein